MATSIVQYVIVRGDLFRSMNWPVGAIIAQACHACCAVTHLYHDDEHMKTYLADLDNMHKVVLEVYRFFSFYFYVLSHLRYHKMNYFDQNYRYSHMVA